jgi:hypothetical protein
MLLGSAQTIVFGSTAPGVAWAGDREAERAREQAQQAAERAREQAQQAAERAREQAQQAAERAREQAQQAAERSNEQARQSTEGAEEREPSEAASRPQREREAERTGARRREEGQSRNRQDDNEPPKTVAEMIKRMTASGQKGRGAPPGFAQLASPEILAVGLTPAAVARARAMGFRVGHSRRSQVMRMSPPPGLDAARAREMLRSDMPGGRFGLNYAYRPYHSAGEDKDDVAPPRAGGVQRASIGGCDTARCYGPSVINWQPQLQSCAKNVRIGIIDTSIDRDHPAFAGRSVEIGNFLPDGATRTVNWHGTGVLAVLAGRPDSGTPGLVPDAHFLAADVYHADHGGHPIADTASLLRALEWMKGAKVNVINMSMSGPYDELVEKMIADMSARGVLFVAAAGNGGPNAPPSYPAAYEQVIAVTAVDKNLRSYIHASHGDYIDVAAPGVGIWTAVPNLREGYRSGTSFAAPHITAILATAYGQVQTKSKEAVLRALTIRDLGPQGRDPVYGRGLVTAPSTCSNGVDPGGWSASIVRAPASPLAPIRAGLGGGAN